MNLQIIFNYCIQQEFNEVQKDQESKIINKLSKKLKEDLILNIQGKYLKDIPIIEKLQSKKEITQIMEECIYSPGEYIFKQNDHDDCSIYYIVKGQVDILLSSQNRQEFNLQSLSRQHYFGEISFILGYQRTFSAKAKSFCRLYKIPRHSFLKIIKHNEYDFEHFQMIKDAIFLRNNFRLCNINCSTCYSGNHLAENCPKTHLTLPKQMLIYRFNASTPHNNRVLQERKIFRFKSVANQFGCYQAIYDINDNLDFHEYLNDLESLGNVLDSQCFNQDEIQITEEEQKYDDDDEDEELYDDEEEQKPLEERTIKQRNSFNSKQTQMSRQSYSENNENNNITEEIQRRVQFENNNNQLALDKQPSSRQITPNNKNFNQKKVSLSSIPEKCEKGDAFKQQELCSSYSQSSLNQQSSPITQEFKDISISPSQKNRNTVTQHKSHQKITKHSNRKKAKSYQNNNFNQQNEVIQVENEINLNENIQQNQYQKKIPSEKKIMIQVEQLVQNDTENKSSYYGSLSSLTSKNLIPSRLAPTEKKLNSFNSFKEGGQFTQKIQFYSENQKSQTKIAEIPQNSFSPKNQNEQKIKLLQYQIHNEDLSCSTNIRQLINQAASPSNLQTNNPYFSMKLHKQVSRQIQASTPNKQKRKSMNSNPNRSQLESMMSLKNNSQQLNQNSSNNQMSTQQYQLQQMWQQQKQFRIDSSISPSLAYSQLQNAYRKSTDIQKSDQLIYQLIKSGDQPSNDHFNNKEITNYYILQNFESAKIFQYYNPQQNYINIIKQYAFIQEINQKKHTKEKRKKLRKISKFATVFIK